MKRSLATLLILASLACRGEDGPSVNAPSMLRSSKPDSRTPEVKVEASSGPVKIALEILTTRVPLTAHRTRDGGSIRLAAVHFRAALTNLGEERIYPPAGFFASPDERPTEYGVFLEVIGPDGKRRMPFQEIGGHPTLTPEGEQEMARFGRGVIEAVRDARRRGEDEDQAKARYVSEYHRKNPSPSPEPFSLNPHESIAIDSWQPSVFARPAKGYAQMPFDFSKPGQYRVRLIYDATLASHRQIRGLLVRPEAVRAATPEVVVTVE